MKLGAVTLLAILLAVAASRADEIVLESGARVEGTVESVTDKEVVILTEVGRMRFSRSMVKEILRGKPPDEPKKPVSKGAVLAWSVEGLSTDVLPAATGSGVALARRTGEVLFVAAGDGSVLWRAGAAGTSLAGLAADPGGVYIATTDGDLARLGPAEGELVWRTRLRQGVAGAPLIHRRGVFLFSPGRGLVGVETGTGTVRGLLGVEARLDTPLASAGSHIVAGEEGGLLLDLGEQGMVIEAWLETRGGWTGRPLAVGRKTVALAGNEELIVFGIEEGKTILRRPVPGLRTQPLAADQVRVYVEIGGALTALDSRTGRTLFRASDLGRPTHLTPDGNRLIVVLADRRMASLSAAGGGLEWTVTLPSPPVAAPIPVGDRILVLSEDGVCRAYRESAAPPLEKKPAEEEAPVAEEAPALHRIHSPLGFTFEVPAGWVVSENVTQGLVALGLRPDGKAARFGLGEADETARLEFELSSRVAVILAPLTRASLSDLARGFLGERMAEAERGGYRLESPRIQSVEIGGRRWSEIRVELVIRADDSTIRLVERALVGSIGEDRRVWLELKTPERFAALGAEDLDRIAAGFAAEDPAGWPAPAEVAAAEAVLEALGRRDAKAIPPLLAEPLRGSAKEALAATVGRHLMLIDRRSFPAGTGREVRVRIDDRGETGYGSMVLEREGDRWLVVSWDELFR